MQTLYGPWDYSRATARFPYDDTPSYPMVGEWVSDRGQVEDWGCGTGWMANFITGGPYRGLDGAWSPFSDEVVDLRTYRSNTPCAVMRHVLEHNWDWRQIAENFTLSWHDRAALVLFIPPQPEDMDVGGPDFPVPDIAVSGPDLFEILGQHGTKIEAEQLFYPPDESIQWGYEAVLLMSR